MSLARQSIALVLTTKSKETKRYIHLKCKRQTERTALAGWSYILGLVRFYDLQAGNRAGHILTVPHGAESSVKIRWRNCDKDGRYHRAGVLPFGQFVQHPQQVDAREEISPATEHTIASLLSTANITHLNYVTRPVTHFKNSQLAVCTVLIIANSAMVDNIQPATLESLSNSLTYLSYDMSSNRSPPPRLVLEQYSETPGFY